MDDFGCSTSSTVSLMMTADKQKLKEDELEHLHHEVRVMKFMRHAHIIRLFQVVDTKTNLYLILELGSGGDMYDHIMRRAGVLPRRFLTPF